MLLVKQNKQFKFTEKLKPGKSPLISTAKYNPNNETNRAKTPNNKKRNKKSTTATAIEQGLAAGAASDDDYDNFQLNPQICDTQQINIKRWHTRSGDPDDNIGEALASPPRPSSRQFESDYGRSAKTQTTTASNRTAEEDEDEEFSLGAVIEESLIAILSALGVLHDPENKVLILPSDSEPFRQVIYNNYILKRNGGSLLSWHHLLVQHFQTEPNSLRKCEELPWHLKICRKWHTLRDTLVDLRAFDLMARHDLRDELHEYWLLLTEGPLPLPEISTNDDNNRNRPQSPTNRGDGFGNSGGHVIAVGKKRNDDDSMVDNESTYSHVLRELDQAADLGISVKEVRRRMAKSQIQPFDIVEELNKSLETWVTVERPSTKAIHRTILQIARFLFDFAKYCSPAPHFLRLGIDLESVMLFGAGLADDIRAFAQANAPPDRSIGGKFGASDNVIQDNTDVDNGGAAPGSAVAKTKGSSDDDAAFNRLFDTKKVKDVAKFPTPDMKNNNLYCYERWIWIQFPWLALSNAAQVSQKLYAIRLEEEKMRREKSLNDPALLSRSLPNTATDHLGNTDDLISHSEQSYLSNKDNDRLLRVWNVKKNDPTVPVYQNSVYRRLAAIKPRTSLSSSLERNVEVTYNNLYEEITSPSHIFKVRMGHQKRDKFRRSFQEEETLNANIPYASHSVRSIKHGTLFPTYEADLKALKKKQLDDMLENRNLERRRKGKPPKKFDIDSALTQAGSKGAPSNPFFMTELDDEIRNISNEEYIDKNRIDRTGAAVITDEIGLEFEANLDRIARMKTIRNKLSQIYKTKVNTLHKMESEINFRNESDQQLIDEVLNSEVLLRSLHERNMSMERNLEEAKQLEDGYSELLKILKNNPPYMEAHVKSLEIEVQLAEKQFEEMVQHRNALYHEHERSDAMKRIDYKEQIQYFAQARSDIAIKKRQVKREIMHLKDPNMHHNEKNRRGTKAHVHASNNSSQPDSPTGSNDSYDSDDSILSEPKELQLTAPVKHFLNAMVRKVTYTDAIVKDTDKTLEDVKQRSLDRKSMDSVDEQEIKLSAIAARKATKKVAKKSENIIIPSTAFLSPAEVAAQIHHETVDAGSLDSGSMNDSNNGTKPVVKDNASVASKGENSSIMSKGSTLPFASGLTSAEYMHYASITKGLSRPGTAQGAISGNNSPNPGNKGNISFGGATYAPVNSTPIPKRKFSVDEMHRLKQTVRKYQATSGDRLAVVNEEGKQLSSGSKELLRAQVVKVVHAILAKTESADVDEFLTRYDEGRKLVASLKAQQVKLDSRLTQLRGEHAELLSQLNDMSFLVPGSDSNNAANDAIDININNNNNETLKRTLSGDTEDEVGFDTTLTNNPITTTTAENDNSNPSTEMITDEFANTDRYLDNKLFNAEVRMNHFMRLYERSIITISEVRTAVGHLANLMNINSGLLSALPRSTPPPISSSEDILPSLQWFEDRVMQLGEALTMDANRPTGSNVTDDSKPLSERQIDLAMLILDMQKGNFHRKLRLSHHQKGAAKRQGMSRTLIASGTDNEGPPFISPSAGVKVLSANKIDKVYDQKMKEVFNEREKREEYELLNSKIAESSQHQSEIQRFLSDGIDQKVSKDMSRLANRLVDKNQGRHASYGLVLESMLANKGQVFQPIVNNGTSKKGNNTTTEINRNNNNDNKPSNDNGLNNHSIATMPSITTASTSVYSSPSRCEAIDK